MSPFDAASIVSSTSAMVVVPESEMAARREEVITRTVTMIAQRGAWDLELLLFDQLLGYRTIYRDSIEVR